MVSLISRAVGAITVIGLALVGLKQVVSTIWSWKRAHDEGTTQA